MLPIKHQANWPFVSGEEVKNRFARWLPSGIYNRNNFSYFLSINHPCGPHGFIEEDFFKGFFFHYKLMGANDPQGVANWGMVGRIYIATTKHCYILNLWASRSQRKKF